MRIYTGGNSLFFTSRFYIVSANHYIRRLDSRITLLTLRSLDREKLLTKIGIQWK